MDNVSYMNNVLDNGVLNNRILLLFVIDREYQRDSVLKPSPDRPPRPRHREHSNVSPTTGSGVSRFPD